jgi:hypothetical protein
MYQKGPTFILAKQYPTTRQIFRKHFNSRFPNIDLNSVLLQGGPADIFLKNCFDTIEETVMCRYTLENLFPRQKVKLVVVTSDFHSKRTNFLFSTIFQGSIQFVPSGSNGEFVEPSVTTELTRAKQTEGELRGLQETMEKFGSSWATWYMHRACTESNLLGVKALIKFFGNTIVNQPLSSGSFPLHYAASYGWTLQELNELQQEFKVGTQHDNGMRVKEKTKLLQAKFPRHSSYMSLTRVSLTGFVNLNLNICRELIAAGADVNSRNQGGATPLHYAISRGVVDIASYLILECNASIDLNGSGKFWKGSITQRELIESDNVLKLLFQDSLLNKFE